MTGLQHCRQIKNCVSHFGEARGKRFSLMPWRFDFLKSMVAQTLTEFIDFTI